jgi:hypothetical protein
MGFIGQPLNAGNLAVQTGTGDGADTTPIATLDYSVGSSESLAIYLDGVKQAVSTYTASGTTLTFTTAPPNGVGIEVVFLALPISLPTPGDNTVTLAKLATGTDGELITWDASGNPAAVAVGTAGQVLTSGGVGVAPTFQASAGNLLQAVETVDSAVATDGTNLFPEDDTIPQNTEGGQVMSLAITPVSSTSELHIFVNVNGSHSASTRLGAALFVDSTANALAFSCQQAAATTFMGVPLVHVVTSGSTSTRTYKVRMAGMVSSGTLTFNGQLGSRWFGGVSSSTMVILEIEP